MDIKKHDGFMTLTVIYIAGGVYAVIVLLVNYDRPQAPASSAYALIFLVWGALILGSAALALKKGREFIEGAFLGAFGPLGFIIEVLLPPIPPAHPPAATTPTVPPPTATRDPQVHSTDAARPDGTE